jgi:hypothetical protein
MQETQRYSQGPDLSPAQHHVISLLAQCVSTTEAAAGARRNTVGVCRFGSDSGTVSRTLSRNTSRFVP